MVHARSVSITSFFFSSRRRHTRWPRDWSSDRVLFRSGYRRLFIDRFRATITQAGVDVRQQPTDELPRRERPADRPIGPLLRPAANRNLLLSPQGPDDAAGETVGRIGAQAERQDRHAAGGQAG